MTAKVLTNAKSLIGARDLSGFMNSIRLGYGAELLDATAFSSAATRTRAVGLRNIELSQNGYWEAEQPDKDLFDKIGLVDEIITIAPEDAEGGVAYCFKGALGDYNPGGGVGEVFAFTINAQASGQSPLCRGTIMAKGAKGTTGNGTARQLGAVSASQKVYSALHVIAASGTSPTLDVVIASDDAEAFPSGITRLTHPQMSNVGANWQQADGAITDDWWRVEWTIGGTGSPSFTIFVTVAIL